MIDYQEEHTLQVGQVTVTFTGPQGCGKSQLMDQIKARLDFESLLEKYMRHVVDCEAWSYVENINERADRVQFTAAEKKELKRIEAKIEAG